MATASRPLLVVGALVAAVVAVVGIDSLVDPGAEKPAHVAPTASPTRSSEYYADGVPYVIGGRLYVDHEEQPGSWASTETVGDYTRAVGLNPDGLTVLKDGATVFSTATQMQVQAGQSPDGTRLAWFEVRGGKTFLVERDLVTGRTLGRVPVTRQTGVTYDHQLTVDMVRDDGTVRFSDIDQWRWNPGSKPRIDDEPFYGTPPGPPAGFPRAYVVLSPDHLWGAWLVDAHEKPVPPDDVYGGEVPVAAVAVQKPGDPSSRVVLPLPPDTRTSRVDWVDALRVSVMIDSVPFVCDVVTHRCN